MSQVVRAAMLHFTHRRKQLGGGNLRDGRPPEIRKEIGLQPTQYVGGVMRDPDFRSLTIPLTCDRFETVHCPMLSFQLGLFRRTVPASIPLARIFFHSSRSSRASRPVQQAARKRTTPRTTHKRGSDILSTAFAPALVHRSFIGWGHNTVLFTRPLAQASLLGDGVPYRGRPDAALDDSSICRIA